MKQTILAIAIAAASAGAMACQDGGCTATGSYDLGVINSVSASAGSYSVVTGPDQSSSSFAVSHAHQNDTASITATGQVEPGTASGHVGINTTSGGSAYTYGGGETSGLGASAGASGEADIFGVAHGSAQGNVAGPNCDLGTGSASLVSVSGNIGHVEGGNYVRDGEEGAYGVRLDQHATNLTSADIYVHETNGSITDTKTVNTTGSTSNKSYTMTVYKDINLTEAYPTDGSVGVFGAAGEYGKATVEYAGHVSNDYETDGCKTPGLGCGTGGGTNPNNVGGETGNGVPLWNKQTPAWRR